MKDLKEFKLFSEYRFLYASTEDYRKTLRFTIRLKDPINVSSLSYAINMIKKRYPYCCVELKKNDIGYSYIKNDRDIILTDINKSITLNSEESNFHLISFQYSNDNRIVINMSHGIADGVASYALIRTLLYYYITKSYNVELSKENVRLVEDEITEEELNDPLLNVKNLINPPKIDLSPGLNIIKENNLQNQGSFIYNLVIDEKELMDYVKSIKATPNSLIALLLAKAIKKENTTSNNIVRISICVDMRKILNTPLAHQSLVSGVMFEYDENLASLNIEDSIKIIRENISKSLKEPGSSYLVASSYYLLAMLAKEKDVNKAKYIIKMYHEKIASLFSGVISYVGKANFGDSEKYITDFKTETDTPSPILIEMAAVNGKFYLDFIQNFKDDRYFNDLKEELENLKLKCEVRDAIKLDLPKFKPL